MKTGWVTKRLGEVCEEIRERIASANILPRQYVGTENMLKDCAGIVDSESVPKDVGLVHYQNGDILLSNIRPYLKKSWLSDREGGCSSDVIVFRPSTSVAGEYLWRVLSQDSFFDYSMLKVGGAKMPRGDRNWIKAFEFSYPDSLAEQKRIVAKIDAAFEKIDKLKANAERNLANAKELFQSALDEAMRPKPGWVEKRLPEISKNLDSKRIPITKANRKPGMIPYYGASGVVDYVEDYIFDGEYLLVSEDGGNLEMRTYPIAFSIEGKNWVNNHAHVIRFDSKELQSFVQFYLNSISLKGYITGAAQPKLTQENLNKIPIPMPENGDVKCVVERLKFLQDDVVKLQSNYTRLIADCAEMRQAVLKEAFEGRL